MTKIIELAHNLGEEIAKSEEIKNLTAAKDAFDKDLALQEKMSEYEADRRLLGKIDYSLLLTFIGFFIFIGNMSRVEAINSFLSRIIDGNEFAVSVGASQVISNVPAALLLSGFSDNYEKLILGTDIGGLGTLIASMASLISFKCISKERPDVKKRYFLLFTVSNIVFLAVLISAYIIIY